MFVAGGAAQLAMLLQSAATKGTAAGARPDATGGPGGLGMLLGMLQAASGANGGVGGQTPSFAAASLTGLPGLAGGPPVAVGEPGGAPPPELLKMLREISRERDAAARATKSAAATAALAATAAAAAAAEQEEEACTKEGASADLAPRLASLETTVGRLSEQLTGVLQRQEGNAAPLEGEQQRDPPAPAPAPAPASGGGGPVLVQWGRSLLTGTEQEQAGGASGDKARERAAGREALESRVAALEATCSRLVRLRPAGHSTEMPPPCY